MEESVQEVRDELLKAVTDEFDDCGKAIAFAHKLNVDPGATGKVCDLLHIWIQTCLIGPFN